MELLTHSRMNSFKQCRYRHWFEYEIKLRRSDDAKALRMGSAFHDALESLANGEGLSIACEKVHLRYDRMPENYEALEWAYERETVLRLVCGYDWRWGADGLVHVAAEQSFTLPLLNPETNAASKTFVMAGKIDGIVTLEDGRHAVLEHKLLSEDLADDSPLWLRMRIEHQISLYVIAARRLGYPVDCVLYNVTRKPTIKPSDMPVLDELGAKIVLDQFGDRVKTEKGTWRQTGDSNRGYVLQTRPMTSDEWGQKLSDDIYARPEFYFARREIPRLDVDLDRYAAELWDIQKTVRDAQLNDRHFRTCTKDTCAWCPFFEPCTNGWTKTDPLPGGFAFVDNKHPELGDLNHVRTSAPEETSSSATA